MMKNRPRRCLIFSMMFAFFLVSAPDSGAVDLDLAQRFALGVRQAHVSFSEEKFTVNDIEFDTEPYNSTMIEVNCAYFFTDYFSVELGLDYITTDADLNPLDFADDTGELKQIPIFLSGRLSLPLANILVPYVGGGPGFFFNDLDQDGVDIDNSIGFFVGGGADVFLAYNIAFNIDVKYVWNQIEANFAEDYSRKLDMNMVVVGAGFKFYF